MNIEFKAKQPIDTGSWASDFEALLLLGTEYSGTAKPGDKVLSASSIGKELYYNILQVKHGKLANQKHYGANTTGSIYQLGLDALIEQYAEPDRYTTAERYKLDLGNGWVVSGEYDIIDHKYKIIIDGKVLSDSSYKKVVMNNINHDYNLQVATYNMLEFHKTGNIYSGALHIVNKGGSPSKDNVMKNMELFMHDIDTIKQMFIDRSEKIQFHLDNNTMPTEQDETCNIFAYGKSNGSASRCLSYCDYNKVCPRYNSNTPYYASSQVRNLEIETPKIEEEYKPVEKFRF